MSFIINAATNACSCLYLPRIIGDIISAALGKRRQINNSIGNTKRGVSENTLTMLWAVGSGNGVGEGGGGGGQQ